MRDGKCSDAKNCYTDLHIPWRITCNCCYCRKEWEKIEIRVNRDTSPYYDYYYVRNWEEYKTEYKTGLWEYCRKEGHDLGAARYRCFSVNDLLRNYKISMKGNYFFI